MQENQKKFFRDNLLPVDGKARYYRDLFSPRLAQSYFNQLMETIKWEHDRLKMFRKTIQTKREMAFYGDVGISYTYSNTTKKALSWTDQLLEIKREVEQKTGESFNACLLNLYHSGEEGMGWHTDAEKDLKENAAIASVSLGAERKFIFKHKESKEKVSLMLENRSLLLMTGTTQSHWLHSLPPSKKVKTPRINLTFRTFDLK